MKYKLSQIEMYQFVCTNVMIVVSFATLCAVMRHAIETKSMVYWRLIFMTALMTLIYLLQYECLSHERENKGFNVQNWTQSLINKILIQLWPFTLIPTLIYTWQYYDLVNRIANPNRTKLGYNLRTASVFVASLGIVTSTLLRDYFVTQEGWYSQLETGHLNLGKAEHFLSLQNTASNYIIAFSVLSCSGSASLLGGTIYWVKTMTKKQASAEL